MPRPREPQQDTPIVPAEDPPTNLVFVVEHAAPLAGERATTIGRSSDQAVADAIFADAMLRFPTGVVTLRCGAEVLRRRS